MKIATLPAGRYAMIPAFPNDDDGDMAEVFVDDIGDMSDAFVLNQADVENRNAEARMYDIEMDAESGFFHVEDLRALLVVTDTGFTGASINTVFGPLSTADKYVIVPVDTIETNRNPDMQSAINWIAFDLVADTDISLVDDVLTIGDRAIRFDLGHDFAFGRDGYIVVRAGTDEHDLLDLRFIDELDDDVSGILYFTIEQIAELHALGTDTGVRLADEFESRLDDMFDVARIHVAPAGNAPEDVHLSIVHWDEGDHAIATIRNGDAVFQALGAAVTRPDYDIIHVMDVNEDTAVRVEAVGTETARIAAADIRARLAMGWKHTAYQAYFDAPADDRGPIALAA